VLVACLGDSITAGSPLWDPDPHTRARIDTPDERSRWQWWAGRRDPSLDLRNHGVYGDRTGCAPAFTDDGDHPSVERHRLLGEVAFASVYASTSR
jgi:hypothetical protein